jgi:hypothetical protein
LSETTQLIRQITAQLRVIGRRRPALVKLEALAVAELFIQVVPPQPVAMTLPFDEDAVGIN